MENKHLKLWALIAIVSLAVVGGSIWMFTSKNASQLKGSAGDAGVVNVNLSPTNPQIPAAEINPGEFVTVASVDASTDHSLTYKSFVVKMKPGVANEIAPGDIEVMVYRHSDTFNVDDAMTTAPKSFDRVNKTATFIEDPAAHLDELTNINFFNVVRQQRETTKIVIKARVRNAAATRGKHFALGLQDVGYRNSTFHNAGTPLPIFGNEFTVAQAGVSNPITMARTQPASFLTPTTMLPSANFFPTTIFDISPVGNFSLSRAKVSLRGEIHAVEATPARGARAAVNAGDVIHPLIGPNQIDVQLFRVQNGEERPITRTGKPLTADGAVFEAADFVAANDGNLFNHGTNYQLIIKTRINDNAEAGKYFAVGFAQAADITLSPAAQTVTGEFGLTVLQIGRMMGGDFTVGDARVNAATQVSISPNTTPTGEFPWGRNAGQMAPATVLLVDTTKDINVGTLYLSIKPAATVKATFPGTKLTVQIFKQNAAGVETAMSAPTVMQMRGKTRIPLTRTGRLLLAEGPNQIIIKANTVEENSLLGRKFILGILDPEDIMLNGDPTPTGTFPLWGNEQTINSQARRAEVAAAQAANHEQAAREAAADQAAADAIHEDVNNSTCPAHSHAGYPVLRRGSSDEKVAHLKKELNVLMHASLTINNTFDQATADQVVAYKRSKGLAGDSVVDAETWGSIESFINPACGVASNLSLILGPTSPTQNTFNYDEQSFEVARYTFAPSVDGTFASVTLKMKPGLADALPVANIVPELMVDLHEGHFGLGEGVVASASASTPLNANGEKAMASSEFQFNAGRQYDLILRAHLINMVPDAARGKKIALGISQIGFVDASQHIHEPLPIYGNTITLPILEIQQPTSIQTSALPDDPLNGQFFELGKIVIAATNILTVNSLKLHMDPAIANAVSRDDIEIKVTRKQRDANATDLTTVQKFNANNTIEFLSGNGGSITGNRGYDPVMTEYYGINVRVLNANNVRGKMLSIGLVNAQDTQQIPMMPPGSVITGNFPAFTDPVALQERQLSAHAIAAAPDMPNGANINPSATFTTAAIFNFTPRRAVRSNGMKLTLQAGDGLNPTDVEAQLFVVGDGNNEQAITQIRAFGADNSILFGGQNGMDQTVLFDPPEVAHKIIVKIRVKEASTADGSTIRVGITGAHDMLFTTQAETDAGLTGTPALSNIFTIAVPQVISEEPPVDTPLDDNGPVEDPVVVESCEDKGQFTFDGPEKPGVRFKGMCIPCPTETFEAFGGKCEADPTPEPEPDTTLVAVEEPEPVSREAAPDLGQSQRITRAPERGKTGPEMIPYFVTVAGANVVLWWRRRKKSK